MLVIAHRGSNRKSLENSMSAFHLSIKEGAERIELDLQLSKDMVIVVNHDDSLMKTTGHDIKISKNDFRTIQQVRLINGESIPTIDDVFTLLPEIELNLEIKGKDLRLVDCLVNKLNSYFKDSRHHSDWKKKIIISSFQEEMLMHLKKIAPNYTRAFLWEQSIPFFVPLDKIRTSMQNIETKIFHPDCTKINDEMMKMAKDEGWIVNTWAPLAAEISEEKWPRLKDLQVNGHCTNFPLEFKNWILKQ